MAGVVSIVLPKSAAAKDESSFGLLVPARVLETRSGLSTVDGQFNGVGLRAAGSVTELPVAGRAGVPGDAVAVSLNVTVTGTQGAGYVTVWPCGETQPNASNLNYTVGQTIPNAVISKLGGGGKVCLYTQAATDILVDVNGYFAGKPPTTTSTPSTTSAPTATTTPPTISSSTTVPLPDPVVSGTAFINCIGDLSGTYSVTGAKYTHAHLLAQVRFAGTTGGRTYFDSDITVPSSGNLLADAPGQGQADPGLNYALGFTITYVGGPTRQSVIDVIESQNCAAPANRQSLCVVHFGDTFDNDVLFQSTDGNFFTFTVFNPPATGNCSGTVNFSDSTGNVIADSQSRAIAICRTLYPPGATVLASAFGGFYTPALAGNLWTCDSF